MRTIADALKCNDYCTILTNGAGSKLFWSSGLKIWVVTKRIGVRGRKTVYQGESESMAVTLFLTKG